MRSTISTSSDASFFPSIGAVNPTLTIIANALRVADIIGRAPVTMAPDRRVDRPLWHGPAVPAVQRARQDLLNFRGAVSQAGEMFKRRRSQLSCDPDRAWRVEMFCIARRRYGHRRSRCGRGAGAGYCAATAMPLQAVLGSRAISGSDPGRQGPGAILGFRQEPVAGRRFPADRDRHRTDRDWRRSWRTPFASSHPYAAKEVR